MAKVQLKDIRKEYSDVIAVKNTNLELDDGEFISFVGPSGCGKTTTLEIIAGLTDATSGTVEIGGRDVTNVPPMDRELAMVFQNIALFPHKSVYENISFGLRMRGVDKQEIDKRVDDVVEILQLEGMLERMPDELSGGQQQRVAIGRAIVREPQVFLMDEPLANLDAKLRVHMRTEIQRIQKNLDVTTIYVTHDQEEAMTMSDRIVVMNEGEVMQFGRPLECYNTPANRFVASFIGSPSMNFLDGLVDSTGIDTSYVRLPLETDEFGLKPQQRVTYGIRPEDIYPDAAIDDQTAYSEPIRAEIDVIEPTGSRMLVYLVVESSDVDDVRGRDDLLMETEPDIELEEGETISVRFDRSKAHLFDANTGEALVHGFPTESLADRPADTSGSEH